MEEQNANKTENTKITTDTASIVKSEKDSDSIKEIKIFGIGEG